MLKYNRIDASELIDFTKINDSRKCSICHYYYFLKINFRLQPKLCDGCHDLMLKAMRFNNVAIVSVKGNYEIRFCYMSKYEAINWLRNVVMIKNSGSL